MLKRIFENKKIEGFTPELTVEIAGMPVKKTK
jgi:hypothetical protein